MRNRYPFPRTVNTWAAVVITLRLPILDNARHAIRASAVELTRFDPARLAAIYFGGVVGALARVGLAQAVTHGYGAWPWATFAVNLGGAFLLGCLVGALRGHRAESHGFALLTTGLCGTLTTFATFQLELWQMLDAGSVGLALLYAVTTIAGGLLMIRAGMSLGGGAFVVSGATKAPGK